MAEQSQKDKALGKLEIASPTRKELTPEEREKLRAKIRERMSRSKLEVKAPAGWKPYWARKDDSSEMARLDWLGFRVVKEESGKPTRYIAQGAKTDGTYQMGDVILMEIPDIEYEILLEEKNERSKGMAEAAKRKFEEDAAKQGAPTFRVKR